MSKTDLIISLLDEILMRLDRIERIVDFSDEHAPQDVQDAFDKVFGKKVDKPKLSIVKSTKPKKNNIVEFKLHE